MEQPHHSTRVREGEALPKLTQVRFETIGLLVFRGTIPLSLVGELIGGIAIDLWSKVEGWVTVVRKEQSREHFCEWFQWLAEQLHKIGRHAQPPAFVQHRDWSPPCG